jgi:hypothetical protein
MSLKKNTVSSPNCNLTAENLGAELVFTQSVSGVYLSFYWDSGEKYGLNPDFIVGKTAEEVFTPTAN